MLTGDESVQRRRQTRAEIGRMAAEAQREQTAAILLAALMRDVCGRGDAPADAAMVRWAVEMADALRAELWRQSAPAKETPK